MRAGEICANCAYFKRIHTEGLCKVNPPISLIASTDYVFTQWPEVDQDDWCGHFQWKDRAHGVVMTILKTKGVFG